MKAPDLKNPSSGFHALVLIRRLAHDWPSSFDRPWKVLMSWLFGSSRRSSHMAWNRPLSSTAIHGKNWLLLARDPFLVTLTGTGSDQVVPSSVERLTSMSPSPCPLM